MRPIRLFHYWRSSSSWRLRWAMAIKGVSCELVHVNLLDGESESPEHLKRNPLGYVPVLEVVDDAGKTHFLAESLPIIEWLEETHPKPALLPRDPLARVRVRQLAEIVNAGTQPLQNLNAMYLHSDDEAERKRWSQHWIRNGLEAYETVARETAGKHSVGDSLTIADLCLIPQCYNARRFEIPLEDYPTVSRIFEAAMKLESCVASAPERFEPAKK